MSETRETPAAHAGATPRAERRDAPTPSGWVGWVLFAGVMMVMIGIFHAIAGLAALFNSDYYLVGDNGLLVSTSFTAWGWLHLVAGVVVALAGFALMAGRTWARVVGVLLAGISAIVNLGFLSAYPVWATIVITLDVVVIYALVVHGAEARSLDEPGR